MNYKILNFKEHKDDNGCLVALQENEEIPFNIKRVYYIYNPKQDCIRGKHAHKDLEQICICLNGSCDFYLTDGKSEANVKLDTPTKGLYIGNMTWREFSNFSKDCVLMVIASKKYDKKDYLNCFEAFSDEMKNINSNGGGGFK